MVIQVFIHHSPSTRLTANLAICVYHPEAGTLELWAATAAEVKHGYGYHVS